MVCEQIFLKVILIPDDKRFNAVTEIQAHAYVVDRGHFPYVFKMLKKFSGITVALAVRHKR